MPDLTEDLEHILAHTSDLWDELRGRRIFVTGGTGFLGCWLLETLAWANQRLRLDASIVVLTRTPEAFQAKAPHLAANSAIRLHPGDIQDFEFPEGSFSYVVHAAATASTRINRQTPFATLDALVLGTRHALDFAIRCGAQKFLLTSSGAVYGQPEPPLERVPETCAAAPDPLNSRSAYGEGKRAAELLCALYREQYGLEAKIARGFTFVGPYMPINTSFAVGNFLQDRLQCRPIRVHGDGTAVRSYLYAADAVVWLWTILVRGQPCRPYNVGSELPISVAALARTVAGSGGAELPIEILGNPDQSAVPDPYVPCTGRAQRELGLAQWIPLDQAVDHSLRWFRQQAA